MSFPAWCVCLSASSFARWFVFALCFCASDLLCVCVCSLFVSAFVGWFLGFIGWLIAWLFGCWVAWLLLVCLSATFHSLGVCVSWFARVFVLFALFVVGSGCVCLLAFFVGWLVGWLVG